MAIPIERIKKYRRWFGWTFILSFVLVMLLSVSDNPPPTESATPYDPQILLTVGSLVTSCTTLIGFIVTTIMTWRKERRGSDHSKIDLEKKKLELEQFRREVADRNYSAAQRKKKMSKRKPVG